MHRLVVAFGLLVVASALGACAGHDWSASRDADGVSPGDDAHAADVPAGDGDAEDDGGAVADQSEGGEGEDAPREADVDAGCPPGEIRCGTDCVDPETDPNHCGECDLACRPAHAAGFCRAGVCELACAAGWVDANAYPFDGCEYACVRIAPAEVPGASCGNDADDDCDGRTDAADPDCATCVPEFCNAADDDCDGLTDEDFDLDLDPMHCGACRTACPPRLHAAAACILGHCDVACDPGWSDLDGLPSTGCEAGCVPGERPDETSCDGVDSDCDGSTDEDWTPATTCGNGWCARAETCSRGTVTCRPRPPAASSDAACDGVDEDCDGATDEDYVSVACGTSGCDRTICTDGAESCIPGGAGVPETCNGIDDDCDTVCDDGFACCAGRSTSCTTPCGSTGTAVCDASSCRPGICTPPAEIDCNWLDDDCDGLTDEGGSSACPCLDDTHCADADPCTEDRCVAGECRRTAAPDGTPCAIGVCCAGTCTDVSADRRHCGSCDVACTSDQSCVAASCAPSWIPLSRRGAPGAREWHTAVWTGTEMIVWGGRIGDGSSTITFADGGRYDPATDTWSALPAAPIESRYLHTAVWTGTKMIVWGGSPDAVRAIGSGAEYTPGGSWTLLPAARVGSVELAGRGGHVAIWTGTEMIVWGGRHREIGPIGRDTFLNDGARYRP